MHRFDSQPGEQWDSNYNTLPVTVTQLLVHSGPLLGPSGKFCEVLQRNFAYVFDFFKDIILKILFLDDGLLLKFFPLFLNEFIELCEENVTYFLFL